MTGIWKEIILKAEPLTRDLDNSLILNAIAKLYNSNY